MGAEAACSISRPDIFRELGQVFAKGRTEKRGPGTMVVAIATGFCYSLQLILPTVSFLYLVIVVLQSLVGDFS
jgi:hypothetical protein